MVALATEPLLRVYVDNSEVPNTPERMEAERAYRRRFVEAARIAAQWREPDFDIIDAVWEQRRAARRSAEVKEGGVICYMPGHQVAASVARGKVHAFEHVKYVWEELVDQGIKYDDVCTVVFPLWLKRIEKWAASDIDPARIHIPPWMSHMPEAQAYAKECRQKAALAPAPAPTPMTGPPFVTIQEILQEKASKPAMRSVQELVCMYTDLRRPVIHGLLREGEVMNVIAPPKTGKSWLATDLALAVAMGRPWLNTFETIKGEVLIIDNELHPETSAQRIPTVAEARKLDFDAYSARVHVENLRGRLRDLVAMETYFNAIKPGRYKLVILDAFYRFMPKETSENDNATMAMLYNHLDRHAARLGCSFVLIHHASKGNQSGKAVTDIGAGAGSQSRATDTHLVLRAHEEEGVVVLDAAVRSWPPLKARCLRWNFPIFNPAPGLDETALRPDRPRRAKKDKGGDGNHGGDGGVAAKRWTAERFVEVFVTAEPVSKVAILALAVEAGVSRREAGNLLAASEARRLIRKHEVPEDRRRVHYARSQP